MSKGLLLHTHTPVLEISSDRVITTAKGNVSCSQVFHATNGYTTYLLPEFSTKLVPLKGHVVAIDPSPEYLAKPLDHTYAVQYDDDYDYLIQRPNDGRPLIFGGGDLAHEDGLYAGLGRSDDSTVATSIVKFLEAFPGRTFSSWGVKTRTRAAWSGVMCLSADELPFLGPVPGKPGHIIAAGYHGHGK